MPRNATKCYTNTGCLDFMLFIVFTLFRRHVVKRQTRFCHANRHWFGGGPFPIFFPFRLLYTPRREDKAWFSEPPKESKSQDFVRNMQWDKKRWEAKFRCRRLKGPPWTTPPSFLAILRIRPMQRSAPVCWRSVWNILKPFRSLSDAHFPLFAYLCFEHIATAFRVSRSVCTCHQHSTHLQSQGNATCPAQLGRVFELVLRFWV